MQKICGIPFPVSLVNYATSPTAQSYFTTLGPYILVVHTSYAALGPNTTKVTTQYNIAANGLARLLLPLLKRTVLKNYKALMSEDLPMRDRRGSLRARGFTFKSDGRARTFPETANLLVENVVTPQRSASRTETVPLGRLAVEGATSTSAPTTDRGVRPVRESDKILAFPRYCTHEGASLDCAAVKKGRVSCPWHAKASCRSSRSRSATARRLRPKRTVRVARATRSRSRSRRMPASPRMP